MKYYEIWAESQKKFSESGSILSLIDKQASKAHHRRQQ
jgi:hypothetical protein